MLFVEIMELVMKGYVIVMRDMKKMVMGYVMI
jgi:hypothetical protein